MFVLISRLTNCCLKLNLLILFVIFALKCCIFSDRRIGSAGIWEVLKEKKPQNIVKMDMFVPWFYFLEEKKKTAAGFL